VAQGGPKSLAQTCPEPGNASEKRDHVGIRLIVDVLNGAPEALTHREKLLLVVLAEDANDDTRVTWNSVERPEVLRGAKVSRSQLYAVLKTLVAKGALTKLAAGQKNASAKYKIPKFPEAAQCPGIPVLPTLTPLSVPKLLTLTRTPSVPKTRTLNRLSVRKSGTSVSRNPGPLPLFSPPQLPPQLAGRGSPLPTVSATASQKTPARSSTDSQQQASSSAGPSPATAGSPSSP
jgi:hypothetical protein